MKKKAQEDKSNFNFFPYLQLTFTVSTCHLPSSPQPCTSLVDWTGTEIRFAFSIDRVLLPTIPLPHYYEKYYYGYHLFNYLPRSFIEFSSQKTELNQPIYVYTLELHWKMALSFDALYSLS